MKREFKPAVEFVVINKDVFVASLCFEGHACTQCYCPNVQCGPHICDGLQCPTLSDYD